MKNSKFLIPVMGLTILWISCAKPALTNLERGKYEYKDGSTGSDFINVSVSVVPSQDKPKDPDKPKTFFDLPDSLPHVFLKLMAEKTKTADELIATLSKPLSAVDKPSSEKKITDFTFYKVTFSFANLKKYYNSKTYMHPNTRLEFLTTRLTLPSQSAITIYTIDKLQNDLDVIDLGSLSRDQTVTFNSKLALDGSLGGSYNNSNGNSVSNTNERENAKGKSVYDADGNVIGTISRTGKFSSTNGNTNNKSTSVDAKVSANVEADYGNTTAIKEAVAVKLTRIKTGFTFSPTSLEVAQRARPLAEISDNIYVTTTFKVANSTNVVNPKVYIFDKLFDENNSPNSADKILTSSRNVSYCPCNKANDINVAVGYEGALRVVTNKSGSTGNNALEYDDKVAFYKFASDPKSPNTLTIKKEIYCKKAFQFSANSSSGKNYLLYIADPMDIELDIFGDDNPAFFLEWLKEIISSPEASKLISSKIKVYFKSDDNDIIFLINDTKPGVDIGKIKTLKNLTAVERAY